MKKKRCIFPYILLHCTMDCNIRVHNFLDQLNSVTFRLNYGAISDFHQGTGSHLLNTITRLHL